MKSSKPGGAIGESNRSIVNASDGWLMSGVLVDPEGAHFAALQRLADFAGARVFEVGCGDGRLTLPIAKRASSVLAFDPDQDAVARAQDTLPAELAQRVTYRVASATAIEVPPSQFDIVLFSWSL